MSRNNSPLRYSIIVPLLFMLVLFVPWLGEMFFYSKGEPREAIVAVSMLDSGDWILPTSYGGDIPYKPPFLAWLIALGSLLLNGGVVSEFTSRFPSALAGVALLVATWRLLAPRVGRDRAWLTMLILATCFEYYRAVFACRVDMVLTACMVGGLYGMYTMNGRPMRVVWTILLLSGATLTKGPVGTLLPCLAMGIYLLIQRQNFFKVVFKLTLIALASFILPALWYWLAYCQGGDGFASLAWEENIGRLTGSMGYESHVNPWYYNLVTVIVGMLPWTLPLLAALCVRRVRKGIVGWWRSSKLKGDFGVFAWTAGLTVFIFYCIPESKRSVYLLPCYPFMAYGIAWIIDKVRLPRVMSVWAAVLAVIAIVVPLTLIVGTFTGLGKLMPDRLAWYGWIFGLLPVFAGLWWLITRSKRADGVVGACGLTYLIMLAYGSTFAPSVMNPRSDIVVAQKVKEIVPDTAKIVTYISADSLMRFYTLNFYLGDRLRLKGDSVGSDEWLITDTLAPEDSARAIELTSRSCDTRRGVYLLH